MKYKVIILGGVGLIIVIALVAFLFGRKGGGTLKGELEIWSFEDAAAWQEVIGAFEDQHKKVNINYVKKDLKTYEAELLNALAAERGPDIFVVNHLWLPRHADKLVPFDRDLMSLADFQTVFVDVVRKDLVLGNLVYALPLYVDTLALYYNRDIFNSAGIALPPKTWGEFSEVVQKITQREEQTNTILLAGAGIGTSNNVTYASDLLALLMIQSGTPMVDARSGEAIFDQGVLLDGQQYEPGRAALEYYTSFADPVKAVYTWNRRLPNDLEAFLNGKTAIYLGYASDLERLNNEEINFAISPMPQVKDRLEDPSYTDVNYANYWAAGVNRQSQDRQAAQAFLVFVTSRNGLFNYLSKTNLPTSRRDLVDVQSRDPQLKVFARQALTADSWRQPDDVKVRQIFNKMIEDVILGRANVDEAVKSAAKAVNNIK